MKLPTVLLLSLLPCALAAAPQESAQPAPASAPVPAPAPASSHVMLKASDTQWGDAPPALERGAQAAVIAGNPGAAGGLFVLRLKMPAGYRVARHWHPSDEHVTVIEGDLTLDMGDGDKKHTATFGPGDYVLLPTKMQHAASTKDGNVVQVHGTGPFELIYVDNKDDPRKRAATDPKAK